MTFWQGGYWAGGGPGYTVEHALTRFGRTPQECYEDVPVLLFGSGAGQTGGGDVGSHTQITSRQHNEAAIPTELDWNPGGGGTPPADPVLAVLTRDRRIGKTTPGISRATLTGDFKRASRFSTGLHEGEEADFYDFHLFVGGADGTTGTQRVTVGVYADAAGAPGAKLGEVSQEIVLAGNASEGWQKVTTSIPIRVTGDSVWLAAGSGLPTARLNVATDDSVTDGLYANADTYGVSSPHLDDPFGTPNITSKELSIVGDYDVVAVGPVEPPDRREIVRNTAIARVNNNAGRIDGLGGGGI